jgi:electron transport complex protein RnfG
MRELIKMVVVLVVLTSFSGGLLAAIRNSTKDQIELQKLQFVKGPAIKSILKGASNDPIQDRFQLKDGDTEESFFVGVFDGKANTVCFESFGKGYGGDIGVMLGVNVETDKIVGLGVTTHSETPGLGALAKDDPSFGAQFKGLSIDETIKVTNDGGPINAVSGATITSRGVCGATVAAKEIYARMKPQIEAKLKEMK